jgi:hypothetical protein
MKNDQPTVLAVWTISLLLVGAVPPAGAMGKKSDTPSNTRDSANTTPGITNRPNTTGSPGSSPFPNQGGNAPRRSDDSAPEPAKPTNTVNPPPPPSGK